MKEHFLFPPYAIAPSSLPVVETNDRAFEIAVFEAAKREIESDPDTQKSARAELTSPSADRGRDVVVKNYSRSSFLGLDLESSGYGKSLFIECKLIEKKRLTLEHVGANVLQIEPEEGSIFLLVTNATLTPRTACLIDRQCHRVGVKFLLIDAWNMPQCLPQLVPEDYRIESNQKVPLVSYQVLRDSRTDDKYIAHFFMRVLRDPKVRFDIAHHSTRDWRGTSQSEGVQYLSRGNLGCWSIEISPKTLKIPRTFTIALVIDRTRTIHEIALVSGDEIARLPLFASEMVQQLVILKEKISSHGLPKFVHIHGKAGSGKSRLLLELFDETRTQGLPCRLITMQENGSILVSTHGLGERDKVGAQEIQITEFFERMSNTGADLRSELILVDDVHTASASILHEIATFAFTPKSGVNLVAAGRSDPTFRRPAYEVFERQIRNHSAPEQVQQIVLGEMSNAEVQAALDSIFKEETSGLLGLRDGSTKLRPVDLVHAVHSLLERNHVQWTDEERLTLSITRSEATDYFSGDEMLGSILEYRYDHVSQTELGSFKLSGFLEVMAVIDNASYSYFSIKKLLENTDVAEDLIALWFDIDSQNKRASFRHSSLKDYLNSKFYGFQSAPQCGAVMEFSSPDDHLLTPETKAAFAFSDHDHGAAGKLIAPFALSLRAVTNISSLNLSERDYPHLAALFAILQRTERVRPVLVYRCLVARAYLNSHHRAYALGFIDNLRLTGVVSALPNFPSKGLIIAAVKQLMAHALINSGDSRTALSLMHDVENFLEMCEKNKPARAIEFDMCDRLQSYYGAQSAFSSARMFFLRARACAHFVGVPALLSLSFSAEFHLSRYLDTENAARLSERQLKHAQTDVPVRALYHAKVNDLVAKWTIEESRPDTILSSEFQKLRSESEKLGFGHLVPRLDYLICVDTILRWRLGEQSVEAVDEEISKANETARRYGYGEYVWLLASLDLFRQIEGDSAGELIVRKACWLIEHLHNQGLTFVAGDELCFQNTVVISNALRAIHEFSDQDTAWRYARKISFSPLYLPKPADQRRRIESIFRGEMLNHSYDPRSLIRNETGYAIILV